VCFKKLLNLSMYLATGPAREPVAPVAPSFSYKLHYLFCSPQHLRYRFAMITGVRLLIFLHMSPTSSDSWGNDILDVDVLPQGESVDITFDTSVGRTCIYDILVVTEDGSRTRENRENLCTTTSEYCSED